MSGFLTTLKDDVVLDAGVLSINGSVFGVSRGGIRVMPDEQWQNLDFDGKRSDVAGLDRKIKADIAIEATFIQVSKAHLARYLNHGSSGGMASLTVAEAADLDVAVAAAYSDTADGFPRDASTLCRQGEYAKDVRVTWEQGDATDVYLNLALAYVAEWRLVGGDKDAAEISAVFRAVNDYATTTSTDAAIHTLVQTS